jgi:uncharacterized protein RhaS with RHS repeats
MRLGYRYYDASVGRFLSRDPIQDGYNWYGYVNNDPVNGVDPEGLMAAVLTWAGAVIVIGGGPENPVADVIAIGIIVIGGGYLLYQYIDEAQQPPYRPKQRGDNQEFPTRKRAREQAKRDSVPDHPPIHEDDPVYGPHYHPGGPGKNGRKPGHEHDHYKYPRKGPFHPKRKKEDPKGEQP